MRQNVAFDPVALAAKETAERSLLVGAGDIETEEVRTTSEIAVEIRLAWRSHASIQCWRRLSRVRVQVTECGFHPLQIGAGIFAVAVMGAISTQRFTSRVL